MTPSAEVRRQQREWQSYDRMHREERSAVPAAWFWITALAMASMWLAITAPHNEPTPAPKPCFTTGC